MNKQELMNVAWSVAYLTAEEMGGKPVDYISYGLKEAWVLFKGANETVETTDDVKVAPQWFIRQNLTSGEAYAVSVGEWNIDRETEKAVHFSVATDYGYVRFWCPKSILVSQSEDEQKMYKAEAKRLINKAKAFKAHAQLVEEAKSLGIKGIRKNMRTETLKQKIAASQAA